jgi:hypothetical protein
MEKGEAKRRKKTARSVVGFVLTKYYDFSSRSLNPHLSVGPTAPGREREKLSVEAFSALELGMRRRLPGECLHISLQLGGVEWGEIIIEASGKIWIPMVIRPKTALCAHGKQQNPSNKKLVACSAFTAHRFVLVALKAPLKTATKPIKMKKQNLMWSLAQHKGGARWHHQDEDAVLSGWGASSLASFRCCCLCSSFRFSSRTAKGREIKVGKT